MKPCISVPKGQWQASKAHMADNVQQAVLKSDAKGACSILQKLTQTESKGAVLASIRSSKVIVPCPETIYGVWLVSAPAVGQDPPSLPTAMQGVAFLTQQKAGFGLAYTKVLGCLEA